MVYIRLEEKKMGFLVLLSLFDAEEAEDDDDDEEDGSSTDKLPIIVFGGFACSISSCCWEFPRKRPGCNDWLAELLLDFSLRSSSLSELTTSAKEGRCSGDWSQHRRMRDRRLGGQEAAMLGRFPSYG
jgi:hypothetical protein